MTENFDTHAQTQPSAASAPSEQAGEAQAQAAAPAAEGVPVAAAPVSLPAQIVPVAAPPAVEPDVVLPPQSVAVTPRSLAVVFPWPPPIISTSAWPPHAESTTKPAGASPRAGGTPPGRSAQPTGPSKADERRVRAQQAWERVVHAHDSGEPLTGTVTVAVKGGLLVDIGGIRGFLPASQARVPIGTAIETLVKTKVPLKVIDIDQGRRRAVVSHRRAVEDERRTRRTELLKSLQVGQVREGLVVRLADFGAFVDLGGIDGLIPMRELAFERVEKVGDVLKVGDKLPVQVLRIEEGGKKISLSRKNALPDPWRDNADVVRRGAVVQGKVIGKEPRLQVELAPGIVGTVRETDADPAQYEIGEEIEVSVRSADRATRRIVLTTMHGAAAVMETTTSSGFAPLGIELGRRK